MYAYIYVGAYTRSITRFAPRSLEVCKNGSQAVLIGAGVFPTVLNLKKGLPSLFCLLE